MDEIRVERRGENLKVFFEDGLEYKVPLKKAEETAKEWGIDVEFVAQIRAILNFAKGKKYMGWQEFSDGYKQILQLMQPEELICYMIDHLGYNLMYPDKLYEVIQEDKTESIKDWY